MENIFTRVTKKWKKTFFGYKIEKIKTWRPSKSSKVIPKKFWWSYDKNCGLLIFFCDDHWDFENEVEIWWFGARNFYVLCEVWSKVLTFNDSSVQNIYLTDMLHLCGIMPGCHALLLWKNETSSTPKKKSIWREWSHLIIFPLSNYNVKSQPKDISL